MNLIKKRAYARAGLLGNPSDGYNGKTISIIVKNLWAEVVLYEWDTVDIVLSEDDRAHFSSVHDLARDVQLHGYYGGIRLIKATIKRFVAYCEERGLRLHGQNFSIRYHTTIPRQVGLAGSSALITATLRCLMEFYGITVPQEAQPTFVLLVEREELGIAAGLQDRVIQAYEGMVYMDFDKTKERIVDNMQCYEYEPLSPSLLPCVYLAYHNTFSEPTEVFHNDLRGRYNRGEPEVVNAMKEFASFAEAGQEALLTKNTHALAKLIDRNFDLRRSVCVLPPWQVHMVETARACGASAKFAGSGGAIVGTYEGEAMFTELCTRLNAIGSKVIKPTVS